MRFRPACPIVLAASVALAQPSAPPKFDVASIKPAAGDPCMCLNTTPGGRVHATSMTLKFLVEMVYHVQDFQIAGGPPWLASLRYDIEAKAETPAKESEVSGALLDQRDARIVRINGFNTEAIPIGHMLIVFNKDVPGALGRIASYLGERGVNIGRLYLGRKKIGETALSLVQIDQAISAQEIAGLSAIQDVISAQQIKL